VVGTARMGESSHEREIKRERGQEGRFNARQVGYRKAKGRPYKKHTYDVIVKAAQTHTLTHTLTRRKVVRRKGENLHLSKCVCLCEKAA